MNREEMKKKLSRFIDNMYFVLYNNKMVKRVILTEKLYKGGNLSLQYNENTEELEVAYGPKTEFNGVLIRDIIK